MEYLCMENESNGCKPQTLSITNGLSNTSGDTETSAISDRSQSRTAAGIGQMHRVEAKLCKQTVPMEHLKSLSESFYYTTTSIHIMQNEKHMKGFRKNEKYILRHFFLQKLLNCVRL